MTKDIVIEEVWEDETPVLIVPPIEEFIPLPKNAAEALPELTPAQEVEMRANTIKLITDMTGEDINPTPEQKDEALALAREMVMDPSKRVEFGAYKNETIAYLAGLVGQMNQAVVQDLAELKVYVINKLIYEIEHAKDPKTRVSALSKLGEIDGVDAFKKRSEVTHTVKSMEEVESELLQTLTALKGRVIDAEVEVVEHKQAGNEPKTDA